VNNSQKLDIILEKKCVSKIVNNKKCLPKSWTRDAWRSLFSTIFQTFGPIWQIGWMSLGGIWCIIWPNYYHPFWHCKSVVHNFHHSVFFLQLTLHFQSNPNISQTLAVKNLEIAIGGLGKLIFQKQIIFRKFYMVIEIENFVSLLWKTSQLAELP